MLAVCVYFNFDPSWHLSNIIIRQTTQSVSSGDYYNEIISPALGIEVVVCLYDYDLLKEYVVEAQVQFKLNIDQNITRACGRFFPPDKIQDGIGQICFPNAID